MKRFNFKVMTAMVAVLMLLLSTVVSAAEAMTYDAVKSLKIQGPEISFQNNDGGAWKNYINWKEDWNAWTLVADPEAEGVYANIREWEGLYLNPAPNAKGDFVQTSVLWKAPIGGTMTHMAEDADTNAQDLKAWIELNGTHIYDTNIQKGKSVDFADIVLDVKAGDTIRFAADANGKEGFNTLRWPVVLTQEESVAPSTETENPKTADAGTIPYVVTGIAALAGLVITRKRK